MDKYLITGFSGFVAQHFVQYLCSKNDKIEILGIDIKEPCFKYNQVNKNISVRFLKKNLLDNNLYEIFQSFHPNYILHLASYSSVAYSWEHPSESFLNNTNIFLNVVMAVYQCGFQTKILSVGSSEEYGNVTEDEFPIKESCKMKPLSPYAVARLSQEYLSKIFVNNYGLNIVMTRSFNHIGVGQDEQFVVPGFIKRILEIKNSGLKNGIIETGNLSIIRDFTDVRDVVRAYDILLHKGKNGEIYNVCSGQGVKLNDMVKLIADICGITVKTKLNPRYIRPNDNVCVIGSFKKIKETCGWEPEIDIKNTINEMIYSMDMKTLLNEN